MDLIFPIAIVNGNSKKSIMLSPETTVMDFAEIIESTFMIDDKVVGLYDIEKEISFPLTTVLHCPVLYGRTYSVIGKYSGIDLDADPNPPRPGTIVDATRAKTPDSPYARPPNPTPPPLAEIYRDEDGFDHRDYGTRAPPAARRRLADGAINRRKAFPAPDLTVWGRRVGAEQNAGTGTGRRRGSKHTRDGRELPTTSNTDSSVVGISERTLQELEELRRDSGFGAHEPYEIFSLFRKNAEGGQMDWPCFWRVYKQIVPRKQLLNGRGREVFFRLFSIFDKDGNGVIDYAEFCAGLQLLCGGSRDDKIKLVFAAFDVDGDGYIDRHEMKTYLVSFFKTLFEFSSEIEENLGGVSAEELGIATAEQCFFEADTDGDGRISFEEFQAWYSMSSQVPFVRGPDGEQDVAFTQFVAGRRDDEAERMQDGSHRQHAKRKQRSNSFFQHADSKNPPPFNPLYLRERQSGPRRAHL